MQNTKSQYQNIVIFTGGKSPLIQSLYDIVPKKDIDFVIAADTGLDVAWKNGIRPDLVVGDFDSLQDKTLLENFKRQQIMQYMKDKDFSDTQLALFHARSVCKKEGHIYLFGGDGGRLDHTISIFESFCHKWRPDVWLCSLQTIYYIKKKDNIKISSPQNAPISFLRLQGKQKGGKIETNGLEWEGDVFCKTGLASLSNRTKDSKEETSHVATVFVKKGKFLLCVSQKSKVTFIGKKKTD